MIGAFFLGEGFQGAHGLPHFGGLHPHGQRGVVQALAVAEELEPALLLGFDPLGGECVQREKGDPAMVEERASAVVAPAVFAQEPDGIDGAQRAVALAALQLLAVEVGPGTVRPLYFLWYGG